MEFDDSRSRGGPAPPRAELKSRSPMVGEGEDGPRGRAVLLASEVGGLATRGESARRPSRFAERVLSQQSRDPQIKRHAREAVDRPAAGGEDRGSGSERGRRDPRRIGTAREARIGRRHRRLGTLGPTRAAFGGDVAMEFARATIVDRSFGESMSPRRRRAFPQTRFNPADGRQRRPRHRREGDQEASWTLRDRKHARRPIGKGKPAVFDLATTGISSDHSRWGRDGQGEAWPPAWSSPSLAAAEFHLRTKKFSFRNRRGRPVDFLVWPDFDEREANIEPANWRAGTSGGKSIASADSICDDSTALLSILDPMVRGFPFEVETKRNRWVWTTRSGEGLKTT